MRLSPFVYVTGGEEESRCEYWLVRMMNLGVDATVGIYRQFSEHSCTYRDKMRQLHWSLVTLADIMINRCLQREKGIFSEQKSYFLI